MDDPTIDLTRRFAADRDVSVRPMPATDGRAQDASEADQAGSDGGGDTARVLGVRSTVEAIGSERFTCEPLRCSISILSCARRHARASVRLNGKNGFPETERVIVLDGSPCRRCSIGAENARKVGL